MFINKIRVNQLDRIILDTHDIDVMNAKLDKYTKDNEKVRNEVIEIETNISYKGVLQLNFTMGELLTSEKGIGTLKGMLDKAKINQSFYYDMESIVKPTEKTRFKIGEVNVNTGILDYLITFDENLEVLNLTYYNKVYKEKIPSTLGNDKIIMLSKGMIAHVFTFIMYTKLMKYLNEDNKIYKKQTYIKSTTHEKKTKKEIEREERRKRLSVSKPKVEYDYSSAIQSGDTRSYERKVDTWEVVGHWRTYKKTGKRVFVRGYKKGNKDSDNRIGKDFII